MRKKCEKELCEDPGQRRNKVLQMLQQAALQPMEVHARAYIHTSTCGIPHTGVRVLKEATPREPTLGQAPVWNCSPKKTHIRGSLSLKDNRPWRGPMLEQEKGEAAGKRDYNKLQPHSSCPYAAWWGERGR